MAELRRELTREVDRALREAWGCAPPGGGPSVGTATDPRFGDYQANVALPLARELRRSPREVAAAIVARLDPAALGASLEVAGPGFINIRLGAGRLAAAAGAVAADPRLGVEPAAPPRTVVVDYSSPNVAKEMHVGHLRSTIIGDALARLLAFCGHRVVRQNHLGDWGTQFGMLVEHLVDAGWDGAAPRPVEDLDRLYREAKRRDEEDPEFAARARRRVVALQGGDAATLAIWRALVAESERHFAAAYRRLGVELTAGDVRGESFYNPLLPEVVADLAAAGHLHESAGAQVVDLEGFRDREGRPVPMIVRKGDGGFLYATTDLAAARFRVRELGADAILYVVDARQADHFAALFQVLRRVGWAPPEVRLEHVAFGMILGPDHKPYKTREGGTVKLASLLDDAVGRADALLAERAADLGPAERAAVAEAVGIGAVKYADLCNDRRKNYVYDPDRMLSFEGNTAPYLQNACVRIRGIFRKGGVAPEALGPGPLPAAEEAERALALGLARFPETLRETADALEPHRLCGYLYELATTFHRFYETCPVLAAPGGELRAGRLRLCDAAVRVLETGLTLLGIRPLERM